MKNIQELLNPQDLQEIEEISNKMTKDHLKESLERLIQREAMLLNDDRFDKDKEMREITLWNISTLLASLCRIELT